MHGNFKSRDGKRMSSEVRDRNRYESRKNERKTRHFVQSLADRKLNKYGQRFED